MSSVRTAIIAACGAVLSVTPVLADELCVDVVVPSQVDVTLDLGQQYEVEKCICLDPVPPKIDVVIAIDLTGSMGEELANLKTEIINIINTVRAGTTEDLLFGLVSYEDYLGYYSSCGYGKTYGFYEDEPFRVEAPIGSADVEVVAAVNALSLGNGGDLPECYGRLLWEAAQPDSGVQYRPGALKILINFGDSVPHDCDLSQGISGCTFSVYTGRDPGRDHVAFTADDIDWQTGALAAAIAAKVEFINIHSGLAPQFCAWQQWTAMTGGSAVQINADGTIPGGISLPELLLEQIESAAASVNELVLVPDPACPLDIWTVPDHLGPLDVSHGITVCLQEFIEVPQTIDPADVGDDGLVECTVDVVADGAVIGQQHITVHVQDVGGPQIACDITGGTVDAACERIVSFTATVTDNFCVHAADVSAMVTVLTGSAVLDPPSVTKTQVGDAQVDLSGSVRVYAITDAPVELQLAVSALDCAGNPASCERTATVDEAGGPAITCSATGGTLDETCAFVVTFEGLVEDVCCVLAEDVTVAVELATGEAVLGIPSISKSQVGPGRVEVAGSVEVTDVTAAPAMVRVTIGAADCDGHVAQPCEATAAVADSAAPTISCDIIGGPVDQNCEQTVTFTATVDDACCVLADGVAVEVQLVAGAATLGTPAISKTQGSPGRVEVNGSVLVSAVTDSPATVQLTVTAADCVGNPSSPCVAQADVTEGGGPEIACSITGGPTNVDCRRVVNFTATVADTCCVLAGAVDVGVRLSGGDATLSDLVVNKEQTESGLVTVSGSVLVTAVRDCPATVELSVAASDCDGNTAPPCVATADVTDGFAPGITCDASAAPTGSGCEYLIQFSATVEDGCCVDADDVTVNIEFIEGSGVLAAPSVNKTQTAPNVVTVTGSALVSELLECPGRVRVTFTAHDCCGNLAAACARDVTVTDSVPPVIHCPPDINLESGSLFCEDQLQEWLDSAWATDNCDPNPTITNNAPDGGFSYGMELPVIFTATDSCGNSSECLALVRVGPPPRIATSKLGSLLVYSKVELRWDVAGTLIQDTYLELTNDYPNNVAVQLYLVQGDPPLPANSVPGERAHTGWNWVDTVIALTDNEPAYWSAATGLPKGVPAFGVLDPGSPQGRPDPEGSGDRILRGFVVGWAVNAAGHEISWNHLSGQAMLLNFRDQFAWEYRAWAAAVPCTPLGEEPHDCLAYDPFGVCTEEAVVPGQLGLDGFQYDFAPTRLLVQFFASDALIADTGDGRSFLVDTDLTLLPVVMDVRQDSVGPTTTLASFNVWNMNEIKFSGARKCVTCWDQTLLSDYPPPLHFLRANLQTDQGKARIEGLGAAECTGASAAPLIGISANVLTFGGKDVWAGTELNAQGAKRGLIQWDAP